MRSKRRRGSKIKQPQAFCCTCSRINLSGKRTSKDKTPTEGSNMTQNSSVGEHLDQPTLELFVMLHDCARIVKDTKGREMAPALDHVFQCLYLQSDATRDDLVEIEHFVMRCQEQVLKSGSIPDSV